MSHSKSADLAFCDDPASVCARASESDASCQPATNHIHSYLHERFLAIINKYFHRVASDSDYFYYCTDEERYRQSRNSFEGDDRLANNNNEVISASGPYKFDETNGDEQETSNDDDDEDHVSNGTMYIHDNNDDDELELQLPAGRRRSDESSSSISNRSRDLNVRGEALPLFICFDCRLVTKGYDHNRSVKTIPLCIRRAP